MKSASARTSVSIEVYDTRKGDMQLCAIFFGKTHQEAKDRAQEYAEFKAQESNGRLAKHLMAMIVGMFIAVGVAWPSSQWTLLLALVFQLPLLALVWWKEGRKHGQS